MSGFRFRADKRDFHAHRTQSGAWVSRGGNHKIFASGEPLTSDSVDKITSEVFGYLYNQEQHSRLNSGKPTVIAAPEQPAEQFTLFGDNEFTMEEPQADESLNRATAYIKDYFEQEFGSAAEIEDPSHVDLAYTTDEETTR